MSGLQINAGSDESITKPVGEVEARLGRFDVSSFVSSYRMNR